MSSSDEDEVFSDNQQEEENEEEEEEGVNNATYVKKKTPSTTTKTAAKEKSPTAKKSHPTYLNMVCEAIEKLQTRNGVSRGKIVDYIKGAYLPGEELNAMYVTKAIRMALIKDMIENSSGNGCNGSFKLKKDYKEQRRKDAKMKETKAKAVAKKTSETTAKRPRAVSKDDMDLPKKVVKKPPAAPKGKENKETTAKKAGTSSKTTIKKVLKKANSTGNVTKQTKVMKQTKKRIGKALPSESEPKTTKKTKKK